MKGPREFTHGPFLISPTSFGTWIEGLVLPSEPLEHDAPWSQVTGLPPLALRRMPRRHDTREPSQAAAHVGWKLLLVYTNNGNIASNDRDFQ